MKKFTSTIFLLCLATAIFCQSQISGKVIEKDSASPISFVNIGVKKWAIGTVSDEVGKYSLKIMSPEDVVTFSSIGYETLEVSAKELEKNNIVKLSKKDYEIDAIEVVAQRFGEDQIFGLRNETRGKSIGFGSRQLGTEIGTLIEIDAPTYLKSANFVLNHAKGDSLFFRVNIYDYQHKTIGENLLKENIFIIDKQRKGTITIDLTAFNLVIENDVLLALEWIKDDKEEGNLGITFDTKKSRKLKGIYVKETSIGVFEKLSFKQNLKPCFYFIGKQVK